MPTLVMRIVSFRSETSETAEGISVTGERLTIGRGRDNDWVLLPLSEQLSRHHCTVVQRDHRFWIIDNRSTNGVFLNNKRIPPGKPWPLSQGDQLRIGDHILAVAVAEGLPGEDEDDDYTSIGPINPQGLPKPGPHTPQGPQLPAPGSDPITSVPTRLSVNQGITEEMPAVTNADLVRAKGRASPLHRPVAKKPPVSSERLSSKSPKGDASLIAPSSSRRPAVTTSGKAPPASRARATPLATPGKAVDSSSPSVPEPHSGTAPVVPASLPTVDKVPGKSTSSSLITSGADGLDDLATFLPEGSVAATPVTASGEADDNGDLDDYLAGLLPDGSGGGDAVTAGNTGDDLAALLPDEGDSTPIKNDIKPYVAAPVKTGDASSAERPSTASTGIPTPRQAGSRPPSTEAVSSASSVRPRPRTASRPPAGLPSSSAGEPLESTPLSVAAPTTSTVPPTGDASVLLDAFLRGTGLPSGSVPPERAEVMMEQMGQVYRSVVVNLIALLKSRSDYKQGLQTDRTEMGATQNNPLKFPPANELNKTLEELLLYRIKGYQPLAIAVDEALEDLRHHSVGTLAGMNAALRALLAHFDPEALQERLEHPSALERLLPTARKARYWELFTAHFGEIAEQAEDDFLRLIGDEAREAYGFLQAEDDEDD